jgi:hypothetical protein
MNRTSDYSPILIIASKSDADLLLSALRSLNAMHELSETLTPALQSSIFDMAWKIQMLMPYLTDQK